MLLGTTGLGIADAKVLVGDEVWAFGVAGIVDNSAAVGISTLDAIPRLLSFPVRPVLRLMKQVRNRLDELLA